jgi:chorismate-pyruvate lyase
MPATTDPFAPLTGFFTDARLPPVVPRVIRGADMPEPYRGLLVSDHDMTPTLERFHGSKLHLSVLGQSLHGDEYRRQVVLLDSHERAVEFGAIHIHLEALPADIRQPVLAGKRPLGGLLIERRVLHHSRPSVYFAVIGNEAINRPLQQQGAGELFGRCNTLIADDGRPIADVVEILPRITPERGAD